jgi:hypothetical protein
MEGRIRAIGAREKNLDWREMKLRDRERQLEEAVRSGNKGTFAGLGGAEPNDFDVLNLNIGGRTEVAVLRRTMTLIEGSLLASKFSGRWDDALEKDRHGNIFVDQPPELFLQVVNFLRAKACETPKTTIVKPPEPSEDLCRLQFNSWNISNGDNALDWQRLADRDQEPSSISVKTDAFATFDLVPVRHSRSVVSYEVTLLKVKAAHIGWRRESTLTSRDSTHLLLESGPEKGIGDVEHTIGLDCCNTGILNDGHFIKLNGIEINDHANIRLVSGLKKLEIYVDGDSVDMGLLALKTNGRNIPCFSVHGELRISAIELEGPKLD